jgi:hypothetical protein
MMRSRIAAPPLPFFPTAFVKKNTRAVIDLLREAVCAGLPRRTGATRAATGQGVGARGPGGPDDFAARAVAVIRELTAPKKRKLGRLLAGVIDHTLLKPEATWDDIGRLCAEARANRFFAVCVNPTWVRHCAG